MEHTSFAVGSHLKPDRVLYQHHGVYIGEGLVIHYAFDGITVDTVERFSSGGPIELVPHPGSPYTGEEIRGRAFSRLGEDEYDLVANNCEHFANWCCTGEMVSEQVEEAVWMAGKLLLKILTDIN